MVKFATQVAASPDASTPKQTEHWSDCKAAYRLFDQEEVTFDAVVQPHHELTREALSTGKWLILNDTTEICFGYDREVTGVGRLGGPDSRGFFLHSALAVSPDTDDIAGLPAQELYVRPLDPIERVSSAQRKHRARETDMWGRVIDQTGAPSDGAQFIHVCDRGADDFDIFCHMLEQRSGWVVRAAQLNRGILDAEGKERKLGDLMKKLPCEGCYDLEVRTNNNQIARTARLEVRHTQMTMPRPKTGVTEYVKRRDVHEIPMWVVEVREPKPPAHTSPLRWVLLTSECVRSFDDAWRIIAWYEKRQLIEEYHKCLKLGCRVEERYYQTGDRLAPVVGLLSVLAVRLLQLKTVARVQPDLPAQSTVPVRWLEMLRIVSKSRKKIVTVRDFFRALAGLGGFLGRKRDGEPGWLTIWGGLEKLLLLLRGAEAYSQRCG